MRLVASAGSLIYVSALLAAAAAAAAADTALLGVHLPGIEVLCCVLLGSGPHAHLPYPLPPKQKPTPTSGLARRSPLDSGPCHGPAASTMYPSAGIPLPVLSSGSRVEQDTLQGTNFDRSFSLC